MNELPRGAVPDVTLWIDQYQLAQPPVMLSVIVTDSKYSITPLWAFPSNGGPYFLRITPHSRATPT